MGRGRVGKRLLRGRPRYGKRYTLHVYVQKSGVVHWELRPVNANDREVEQIALKVAKKVEKGEVLLWDRLGRSGRAKNPVAQHYNPRVIQAFNCRGAKVVHLPPKGKYLDPMELLFNDLKEHYIRPKYPSNDTPLTDTSLCKLIRANDQVAPLVLPGFFRKRANGKELKDLGVL